MGKFMFICLLLLFVQQTACENVIYKLTKEEYARMPPKNHLDSFEYCLHQPGGVYCTAHADVVSDGPNELLDMMRGYSAAHMKHFNYTHLMYGLCLKQRCRHFYSGDDEAALRNASEACLNHSLSAEFGLKARITELNCYFENKSKFRQDWLDWAVVAVALVILALNAVGTAYDINRDQTKPGNAFLTAFSLRVNWKQLTAPLPSDPKTARLRCLHGIRALTSFGVIVGHQPMAMMVGVINPQRIENNFDDPSYHILWQGNLITSTFFLMSGFLLIYDSHISSEKKTNTWKTIPKRIFTRWLRLTPVTVVCLLLAATWMRFTTGPMWEHIIGHEVHDCRRYWYNNLLYINNFFDHSQCVLQTWYLACDMQLHIVGLVVLLLAPKGKARWWILGALCTVSVMWTGYYVYTMDLDPIMLTSPSGIAKFFMNHDTFNYVFKRSYTNLLPYVTGMVFGYMAQDWNHNSVFEKNMTKYRYWVWLLVPSCALTMALPGFIFFRDEPRASMALRMMYGLVIRTFFIMHVMGFILGAMFRIENLYRGILEWNGWVPISRLGYCIFSTHMFVVRYLNGTRTTLVHWSLTHAIHEFLGVLAITIPLSCAVYLLVEAPFEALMKMALTRKPARPSKVTDSAHKGKNEEGHIKNKDE